MTWTFEIKPAASFEALGAGRYKMRIRDFRKVEWNNQVSLVIEWEVLEPYEDTGKTFTDKFYIQHEKENTRDIAINSFYRLCGQIKDMPQEELTERQIFEFLIDKEAYVTLTSKQVGDRTFTNASKREIISQEPVFNMAPAVSTNATVQYGQTNLNDEVPF